MNKLKSFSILALYFYLSVLNVDAQGATKRTSDQKLHKLIELYSQAREKQDTVLLKTILTHDIDQLVSTGEWRNGLPAAIKGMLRSTANSSGNRTITIDKIKYLGSSAAIVDTRYLVPNADGSVRNMWSSFTVIKDQNDWKISAIRNMMPTVQN